MVQVLLDAGMDVHSNLDYPTNEPISSAVVNRDLKMVKFLLEKGANPHHREICSDLGLLAYAAKNSSQDIMLALLEHGAQIPCSGALVMAAMEGHISVARLLLEKGADVNEVIDLDDIYVEEDMKYLEEYWGEDEDDDEDGKEIEETDEDLKRSTALHIAAKYGRIEMVKFLLKTGAKKHVLDWELESPADKAKQRGHTEILKLLGGVRLTDCDRT